MVRNNHVSDIHKVCRESSHSLSPPKHVQGNIMNIMGPQCLIAALWIEVLSIGTSLSAENQGPLLTTALLFL